MFEGGVIIGPCRGLIKRVGVRTRLAGIYFGFLRFIATLSSRFKKCSNLVDPAVINSSYLQSQ
jgi:hypothetical protein